MGLGVSLMHMTETPNTVVHRTKFLELCGVDRFGDLLGN